MKKIYSLAFATMLNVLALAIIIPVMPFQLLSFGASPLQATIVYSLYSAASVLTLYFWGKLSDRFGRKPILGLSIGLTALCYIFLAFADSVSQVYMARIIAGAFAAWLPVSQAFVGDVIPPEKRAPAMGLLGVGFGVGFTVGPALGGWMASYPIIEGYPFALPYAAAASLALLCLIFSLIFITEPESLQSQQKQPAKFSTIWQEKPLILLIALYFGVSLLFTGIEGVLTVWSNDILDWQTKDVGFALTVAGLGSIIAQGYLIRLSTKKLGEIRTTLWAIVGLSITLGGFCFAQSSVETFGLLFLLAIVMGLHNPAIQSLISQAAPEHLRGGVMGIAQASASFARVLGPIWAGLLFQNFGGNAPFIGGFILALFLTLMAWPILRLHRRNLTA